MYKITELKIENFRAFYGQTAPLVFPNGENVLVYGENGSGKSSLFLAIREWMRSGLEDWDGRKHQHRFAEPADLAKVGATMKDLEGEDTPGAEIKAGAIPDAGQVATRHHPQVVAAWNGHGWQTYRELLKAYINDQDIDEQGNFFRLLVIDVLGDFIPNGATSSIREMWKTIMDARILSAKTLEFKGVVSTTFSMFNGPVNDLLKNQLEPLVNALLRDIFQFNIKISFGEIDLKFQKITGANRYALEKDDTKPKAMKKLIGDKLQIQVDLFSQALEDYCNSLNEARLNAIALCMFLASRIMFPVHTTKNSRTLLLDDIFVGLDTANRIPLLEILTKPEITWEEDITHEGVTTTTKVTKPLFSEYQIFLSTYDRHWFEFAQRWFQVHQPNKWKTLEMYVNHGEHVSGKSFDKPIILQNVESDFEKGVVFLNHVVRPDFPSAANCFRKVMEKLLDDVDNIPKWVFRTLDPEKIKDANLTQRARFAKMFLEELGQETKAIDELLVFLPNLLHPLSHYREPAITPYKQDLVRVMNALKALEAQLLLIRQTFQIDFLVGAGEKVQMKYTVATNVYSYYTLYLEDPLFSFIRDGNPPILSTSPCYYDRCWGLDSGQKKGEKTWRQKERETSFQSLEECYNTTHQRFVDGTIELLKNTVLEADYRKGFEVMHHGAWVPLLDRLASSTNDSSKGT